MAKIKTTPTPDCRHQRQRTFETLSNMLKSQQLQIEALVDDRYFLQKYIHIQHDHWSAKCNFLESHVAQLKKEEEKFRKLEKSKLDLVVEMKDKEAFCYKKYSDFAESDLDDFRACVETLNAKFYEMKKNLKAGASSSKDVVALEGEISNVKHSWENLISGKEAEIVALFTEKDFVSNQLKIMENDYISILESKKTEMEQANEAVVKLQNNLQELRTIVSEKENMIIKLEEKLDLAMREHSHEAEQANEKFRQLKLDNDELNLLVKEKDEIIMKLRRDLAKFELDVSSCTNGKSRSDSARYITWRKHRSSTPVHGKRRNMSADSSRGRLRLFHANFKVPKLKDSPSPMPC